MQRQRQPAADRTRGANHNRFALTDSYAIAFIREQMIKYVRRYELI
jgi:hypothetical protein